MVIIVTLIIKIAQIKWNIAFIKIQWTENIWGKYYY